MIITKVGEPFPVLFGDVWFDPTTRVTKVYTVPHWTAMIRSSIYAPSSPIKYEVWINATTHIPSMWDGNNWIPAVQPNYTFPSMNPTQGDIWIEPMSQIAYVYFNGSWINANGSYTLQTTSVNNIQPVPSSQGSQGITVPTVHNPATITIIDLNQDVLVEIDTSTGIITYGPNYTPDAAAQIFWRAISGTSPKFMQTQIDMLTNDLKNVSSRLAAAEDTVLKFHELGYKLPEPPKPFNSNDSWDRAMGIIK